jgi:hypothetical protein
MERIVGAISGFASVLGSRCLVLLVQSYRVEQNGFLYCTCCIEISFVSIETIHFAALISKSITCLAKGHWTSYNSKLLLS